MISRRAAHDLLRVGDDVDSSPATRGSFLRNNRRRRHADQFETQRMPEIIGSSHSSK